MCKNPPIRELSKRLGNDWTKLADHLGISQEDQRKWPAGNEAREIWFWLQNKNRLTELKPALIKIERADLAEDVPENPQSEPGEEPSGPDRPGCILKVSVTLAVFVFTFGAGAYVYNTYSAISLSETKLLEDRSLLANQKVQLVQAARDSESVRLCLEKPKVAIQHAERLEQLLGNEVIDLQGLRSAIKDAAGPLKAGTKTLTDIIIHAEGPDATHPTPHQKTREWLATKGVLSASKECLSHLTALTTFVQEASHNEDDINQRALAELLKNGHSNRLQLKRAIEDAIAEEAKLRALRDERSPEIDKEIVDIDDKIVKLRKNRR